MAHELDRLMRAFGAQPWFIEPRSAARIAALIEFRAANGPRADPYRSAPAARQAVSRRVGHTRVIKLIGPIVPRADAVADISQQTAPMAEFMREFRAAAANPDIGAIVLEFDSPGGQVDLVPEAADMVRRARRGGRPIVAIANTLCCSAAYWIASQADELVVTPSGEVGSIGVYTVHEDLSELLKAEGVTISYIFEGPRKTEGNPFEPLGDEARAHFQANVRTWFGMFVNAVARGRKVDAAVVRADPEAGGRHFGGGRSYIAHEAVRLGMADRVETLDALLARLQKTRTPRAVEPPRPRHPAPDPAEAARIAARSEPASKETTAAFLRSFMQKPNLSASQREALARYRQTHPEAYAMARGGRPIPQPKK